MKRTADPWSIAWKQGKRFFVVLIGFTLIAIGAALVILPGPGFLIIIIGLVILGSEFVWARRWMKKIKEQMPGPIRREIESRRWRWFFGPR